MDARDHGRPTDAAPYRTLPPSPRLDDVVASVDADPVVDPAAGRNVDQHAALRDD